VVELAEMLRPSPRGELEITDLNRLYMLRGQLHLEKLDGACLAGHRHPRFPAAGAQFIQTIQARQGLMVACPEEIAYHKAGSM